MRSKNLILIKKARFLKRFSVFAIKITKLKRTGKILKYFRLSLTGWQKVVQFESQRVVDISNLNEHVAVRTFKRARKINKVSLD